MTLGWGYGHFRQQFSSVTFLNSSLFNKSKLFNQLTKPSGAKLHITIVPTTACVISKYTKKNLYRIFKTVLEAPSLAFAPASAPATFEELQDKPLKARCLDVYCRKSHINCYNLYQQCEDYFAIAGATTANQILFIEFFLRDRIGFHC